MDRNIVQELCEAAERVLAGLHERIDEATDDCVPVFDGIAELHDAISKLKAGFRDGAS